MKDSIHHLRHIQRKVIQSSRKVAAVEERTPNNSNLIQKKAKK